MKRREFLAAATAALSPSVVPSWAFGQQTDPTAVGACCTRTYASPAEAMRSPAETLLYVPGIYVGTGVNRPDYLATVDLDPRSTTFGQVIHRLEMPEVGDELHHFGWNSCSSCHGVPGAERRFIVLPGLRSSRIHIIDTTDPRVPRLHQVIEPEEISEKTNLSWPHTVHCRADGRIMISMLGDAAGNGPGGFLELDEEFNVAGRWEASTEGMQFGYDFWYQPRQGVMVSSEWGAPNTIRDGFNPDDVTTGKYGRRLYFWDWQKRRIAQTIDLGDEGLIPLEVRFHHDPDSDHGFVGAALSSSIWHWHHGGDAWHAEKVVQVEPVEMAGWPFPVPGLITDIVLSMDDRFLYFSNWLHGDVRQYDVSDPAHPRLAGRVWLGGVLGRPSDLPEKTIVGGPQMLQLSLDGRRLYVTSSLYSSWDNQFYPDMAKQGSCLLRIDCDPERGGMTVNPALHLDFGREPHGPARAHEMRFPGGDCTSDIWV